MPDLPSFAAVIAIDCRAVAKLRLPWEIVTTTSVSRLYLCSQTTKLEVGLAIGQLIVCNRLDRGGNVSEVLNGIINSQQRLILPGGLQVSDGEIAIAPSCCCGLETWREWLDFRFTGGSPWLGHDPTPWVEKVNDDVIRVWADEDRHSLRIDFTRRLYKIGLAQVRQDLDDFLIIITDWAAGLGLAEPERLAAKFDRCFSISEDWRI